MLRSGTIPAMTRILSPLVLCAVAGLAVADAPPASPSEAAARLEARMAAGEGVLLPDADAELVRHAGTIDLAEGDWPAAFHAHAGETVCVAVSPTTGDYGFFDESGECFFALAPVLPTTDNWVAPFRHAEPGPSPDDDLYAPWRLVDVWLLSTTEDTEGEGGASSPSEPRRLGPRADSAAFESHAENAEPLATRGADGPATSLCFTAFSYTETNLFFAAAWPTNETLPESVLDLYGKSNLSSRAWTFLSSHPATNPPASFSVEPAALPWYVEPTQHVHDASCVSLTNVVLSPLDGVTVYTNAFWSCSTNRTPAPPGFFQLGTHHDTDGDGLFDSFEKLASGTDPLDPDTDGDGVPDGLTRSEWRSHPLWAENGDCTNLVVFLCEPITNGFAALRFDDLCIPLSTNAGPWCLCIPTNAVVDGALVVAPDVVAELWYGPPEAVDWTPPGPRWTWDVPSSVAVPIWCDDPLAVFGGRLGGGSCRLARPALRVRSDEPGQEGSADVCVHGTDGLVRFSWSVEPSVCTGLRAHATGALSDAGDGRSFSIDVSDAVPGLSGARAGALSVESEGSPFWGDDVLFGTLSQTVSAHRCEGLADPAFGFCLSCGVAHGGPPDACHHASWCATKTNLLADCDCAEPFVRIGNAGTLRLVGEDRPCCSVHDGFPQFADVLSAPGALHAGVSNGVFLAVEPESRSPMIGGFVAHCRIYDGDGGTYRDLSVPFTCADLGIDPDFAEMWIPDDAPPAEYFVANGTLHLARRPAPYPIRLWNESPSDARLVFSFSSPTNGPTLRETPFGIPHPAFSITNAAPFSALDSDETVYLDASCSNALATLTLTLSDPIADRTFLSESLAVKVVDTAVGEHWRVRSATDRLSWDFSDAPEDVYAYLWRPNADGPFGDLVGFKLGKTPSLSLDLPPGDYLLDFYFPRVYDGGSWAAWSTNYLHIRPVPEFARDVVGVQCRTDRRVEVALTNDTFHSDIQWTLSPIVANGPRLFATSNSVAAATSMSGVSNVWVSAGTVPGVYQVTASYPGFTNATAYVIDPIVDINGDFFRNGTIADDPRESDPVCFTNDFGFVIPCNNNDSDGNLIPDVGDTVVNGFADAFDLNRIVVNGLGLDGVSDCLLSRIKLRMIPFNPVDTSFPELRPWQKIRLFPSDEPETETIGDDVEEIGYNLNQLPIDADTEALVFVEGKKHGASLGIRLQASLDGIVFGEDAIQMLVEPVVVLSNLDPAYALFASPGTDLFSSNLLLEAPVGLPLGFIDEELLFPQDSGELCQTFKHPSPPNGETTILTFRPTELTNFISATIGTARLFPTKNNDGGNIESTPPLPGFPLGRIIVGDTISYGPSNFLAQQSVQTRSGELVVLPVDWLTVGHVDELFSFIESTNGYVCLVADLDLGISLLSSFTNHLEGSYTFTKSHLLSLYSNPDEIPFIEEVRSNLSDIRMKIAQLLGVDQTALVRVPVLFSPSHPLPGRRDTLSHAKLPNLVNLLFVKTESGNRKIIMPRPDYQPFQEYMENLLGELGYDSNEYAFIDTSELHPNYGEVHCGTNVQRLRSP